MEVIICKSKFWTANMTASDISFDIEAGVNTTSDNIVEKFTFKWNITNFLKLVENVNEVYFSTTTDIFHCKMIRRNNYIKLNILTNNEHVIATVLYRSNIQGKDGAAYFEQSGKLVFDLSSRSYDKVNNISKCVFEIPKIPENEAANLLPNDVLTFQCIMFFSGHYLTAADLMPNPKIFQSQKISHDLKNLLQKQEHSDFSLHVGVEKVPVHKAILCARSPVFDKMFSHNMIERSQNHIEISDIELSTLHDFVSFLYTGELENLSWEKAMKLYYAADKYAVEDLQKACSEFINFHLNVNDVCNVLILADRHADDTLKTSAKRFVRLHLSSVKETDDWCQLVKTHPKLAIEILN